MKGIILGLSLLSTSSLAMDREAAIDALWSIDHEDIKLRLLEEDLEDSSNAVGKTKISLGNWIKYHSGEKFKWKVFNNLDPIDGFDFGITINSCAVIYLTPVGGDAGIDSRAVGYSPSVRKGMWAVWEANKKSCVNRFTCGVEVAIKGLESDPNAKRQFGPYTVTGSTTAPDYDCFLDAKIEFVFD